MSEYYSDLLWELNPQPCAHKTRTLITRQWRMLNYSDYFSEFGFSAFLTCYLLLMSLKYKNGINLKEYKTYLFDENSSTLQYDTDTKMCSDKKTHYRKNL